MATRRTNLGLKTRGACLMRSGALSWLAVVRRAEDGFFTAPHDPPLDMGSTFSVRAIAGLPRTTQFFRVEVDLDGSPAEDNQVWVVCTALPTGTRPPPAGSSPFDEGNLLRVRSALGVALPDAVLCFTTEDREGFTHLIADPARAPAIAAAVAVVKYYAAWDESDPINVTVNHDEFAVSVSFTETDYRATVSRRD